MLKSSLDGICDESEYGSVLLSAGLDHREQRFHEAASGDALCPEGKFSPDHCVTKRSLGCVVGGFNVFMIDKRPEVIEMVEQFRACRFGRGMSTPLPFLQSHVEQALKAICVAFEPLTCQSSVANAVPVVEHFVCDFQQLSAQFGCACCS